MGKASVARKALDDALGHVTAAAAVLPQPLALPTVTTDPSPPKDDFRRNQCVSYNGPEGIVTAKVLRPKDTKCRIKFRGPAKHKYGGWLDVPYTKLFKTREDAEA